MSSVRYTYRIHFSTPFPGAVWCGVALGYEAGGRGVALATNPVHVPPLASPRAPQGCRCLLLGLLLTIDVDEGVSASHTGMEFTNVGETGGAMTGAHQTCETCTLPQQVVAGNWRACSCHAAQVQLLAVGTWWLEVGKKLHPSLFILS